MIKKIIIFLLFSVYVINAGEDEAKEAILKYKQDIITSSQMLNISPRIVAAIIFTEHNLNYKFGENLIDFVFAKSGYNSSIGIAQVKITTAEWIEKQIHDKATFFYMGEEIENLVPISKNRDEIIDRLENPHMNILYAACYIAMIQKLWNETFASLLFNNKIGIIATIYTLGIFYPDGKIRKPHLNAEMNNFGKSAQDFYDSFQLRNDFSQ